MIGYQKMDKGYGVITLNRPEKRNAISEKMANAFHSTLQQARLDALKFLVITGAEDKMFCAGGDLTELHGNLTPAEAYERLRVMKGLLYELVTFPVPVICLLNGNALGGGCEIATACDFRIAKAGTSFGFVQTKLGILPGWGGGALLYEKTHPSFALQWLTEAAIYEAEKLVDKGWVHHIVDASAWHDYEQILQPYVLKSYNQMKLLKQQYLHAISISTLAERMEEEVRNCAELWDSPEHKQAVKQFLEKNNSPKI